MNLINCKNQRNYFAIIFGVYVLMMSGLFLKIAYTKLNDGIILKVRTNKTGIGTYKQYTVPGKGYFISGMEGELSWKPANFTQSMLLVTVNNKAVDFLDIIGVVIMGTIILIMFNGSKNGLQFTTKMSTGFMIVIFAIALTTTLQDMVRLGLARNYIPLITNGQFKGNYTFKGLSYNYIVYPLLMFLIRIPKRGLELQKEADLTI